ncbi:MAG TPA: ribosome-associated ATPase/putative transporter RbbA [Pseudomonadales bacterium]|nr:ribosome-associated ATPase/putative transporter RbbA [Pseudomonadales bacterium]
MAIAVIEQIEHRYGDVIALDKISLAIPQGILAGIIGPDGVGKSTLLGLIAGAKKIQAGSLLVFDQDLRDAEVRKHTCRRVAYMPQGLGKNLYPTLSVMENIHFFASLFGERGPACDRRIQYLLDATGLAPFVARPAAKLSGGMKQKLGLCCALIHEPDLLILDEPTTGVDPLSRRQFWQLLADLRSQRSGMSILVATAYMEEASHFDWLAMMDEGRVLAQGEPTALLRQTRTNNLDAAFISLLPAHKRENHEEPVLPPMDNEQHSIVISARNLCRTFADFKAVDNVNFEIRQGEIFGFLGSNGCGKSTTMKMLTGLLPATSGEAFLFGKPVDVDDINTRRHIGYMSQSFSLYEELTVQQNLDLHGRIFGLSRQEILDRSKELLRDMQLEPYANQPTVSLPLGVRQRLSLAVAIIHRPSILILDEPTSGVDPVARDGFWMLLIELCRQQKVTIFITTHYMNEAERCDRVSLMHNGCVLASGSPDEIREQFQVDTLEAAFIHVLEVAQPDLAVQKKIQVLDEADSLHAGRSQHHARPLSDGFSLRRLWAYARRETLELMREPVHMTFSMLAPIFLLVVLALGINFDVDNLGYAVLDHDQSPASREYLREFASSPYFTQHAPLRDYADLDYQLSSGNLQFVIEIPPDFGRQLAMHQEPSVGAWIDGSYPFRAERTRGYIGGLHRRYLELQAIGQGAGEVPKEPYSIETRFRYNQDMASIYAMAPSVIALLVTLIPTMLMAVAVVREKELGSIINFYATPTRRLEFLWGKQLPYAGIAMINFVSLVIFTRYIFDIPLKGSLLTLLFGGFCYSWVSTALGLVVSAFTSTQIAALFAALIMTMIPSVNFAGMLKPVASLEGAAYWIGNFYPTTFIINITVGTFTKGLDFQDLWRSFAAIGVCFVVFTSLSAMLLRKQDR